MVQIAGKYKVGESKNLYEFMLALGAPENLAKVRSETKYTLEVAVDGKNINLTTDSNTTKLVEGKEVEEKLPSGEVMMSTAKMDRNVITVTSKTKEGESGGVRIFTFNDKGIELVMEASRNGKTISATRQYIRI